MWWWLNSFFFKFVTVSAKKKKSGSFCLRFDGHEMRGRCYGKSGHGVCDCSLTPSPHDPVSIWCLVVKLTTHASWLYKMGSLRWILFLFASIYLLSLFDTTDAFGSCLLNQCICQPYVINCEDYSNTRPHFTTTERRYVNYLKVRWSHVAWISKICTGFPQLESVFFGYAQSPRDTPCPTLPRCPRIQVECL